MSTDKPNVGLNRASLDVRRRQILECADRLFLDKGYANTTTSMIASGAFVSKRALYECFADKEAIYHAVLMNKKALILDLPRPSDEDLPILESLIRIFRLDMETEADLIRENFLRRWLHDSIESPSLTEKAYDTGIISPREMLADWLKKQEVRGKVTLKEDVFVYAGMLMDIVFGALIPKRKNHESIEVRKAHILKALQLFTRCCL